MSGAFAGKVALVTGGAAGIGRASALAFARAGARVVVADVSPRGEETARAIEAGGGEALFVLTDVCRSGDVAELLRRTLSAFGRLDVAHNNAGVEGPRAPLTEVSEEEWDRTLAVNLKGVWLSMRAEIPAMLSTGGGSIVNTASVYGLVGARKLSTYAASKHALVGLTRSAALEWGRQGIRVNAVCPGLIDTQMIDRAVLGRARSGVGRSLDPRRRIARAVLRARQPSGRMGTPEEVAEAVLWLCSPSSSYVNGHALVIDGGMVVH
jgi:NAD(P)-dependent dehydrogenase (short-subunit alcohol dehydrogenase family)